MSKTLRYFAEQFQAYTTLEDWLRYAEHLGVNPSPDAPLSQEDTLLLSRHIAEFASAAAAPVHTTRPPESVHTAAPSRMEAVPDIVLPAADQKPRPATGRPVPAETTPHNHAAPVQAAPVRNTKPAQTAAYRKKSPAEAAQEFEELIRNNYVFMDMIGFVSREKTCHAAPKLDVTMEMLLKLLEKHGKKLNVPYSAYQQVEDWSKDSARPDLQARCQNLLRKLVPFYRADRLVIRRTQTDLDPMQDMITLYGQYKMKGNLLVITQDDQMATSLLSVSRQKSVVTPYSIQVKRSSEVDGMLVNTLVTHRPVRFRICTSVREGADQVLPVTEIPGQGDEVYTTQELNGSIRLEEVLGAGGEGSVYKTNTHYVAKIYRAECCTEYRREKVLWMVDAVDKDGRKLACDGICFPVSALYNRCGEFVGYLMPMAKGRPLSNAMRKNRLMEEGWKRSDLAMCASQILYKIQFLHDNNILMGDINPKNFLVASPTEVYIVDTDSFQLNDLPCPVAFTYFIAPEILARQKAGAFNSLSEIMRTKESERFAVAVLLFFILLPGKRPYSRQNGSEDEKENNLNMDFPYPLGKKGQRGVPLGPWRFMWSHLSPKVKRGFHKVFDKEYGMIPGKTGVDAYNTQDRPSIRKWIIRMQNYAHELEIDEAKLEKNPNAPGVDPECVKLYPTRLKWKDPNNPPVMCMGGCGRWAEKDQQDRRGQLLVRNGRYLCPECGRKAVGRLKCDYCENEYDMTMYDKYRGVYRPYLCPDCRKRIKEIVYDEPCINSKYGCPNRIRYTLREAALYKLRNPNRPFPKVCQQCLEMGR